MVQAAPAWRSAGRTFFDQPRQVLTVAGNGLASYRLSDAVLRGREVADVSAAEERNRVALGASRSLQCWKICVVGKCPQGRASTGNASDRRSRLIVRYPRRFAH